jgi:diguanylate cyclase (GGDEF)-like protein
LQQAAEKVAYLAQGFRKLDIDEVLDLIINQLPSVFNAECASLFLYNEDTCSLDMVRSNYLNEPYKLKVDAHGATPMMMALKEDRVIILPHIQESSLEFMRKEVLGDSCIIIPFLLGEDQTLPDFLGNFDKVSGVLNMAGISDMEPDYIVQYTASLIKNIIGINILNAKLYQKTQQLALFDSMTGLYNKQMFAEFLTKECDYSERHGVTLYLAMIDVDEFKTINDTHGHRVGDEVIVHLGRILKKAARASDVLARYGGDEFACILRCDNESEVISVLDRLRHSISNGPWPMNISLTASIGFSRYSPQSGDSIKELIDRADAALYQVKNNGKDGVKGNKK